MRAREREGRGWDILVFWASSSSSSSSLSLEGSSVVLALLVVGASVVVVVVVLSFFLFFFFFLVVCSVFSVVASLSSSSCRDSGFLGGDPEGLGGIERPRPGMAESLGGAWPALVPFSTQQRMLEVGHWTSSSTVSHIRLASAWMHLPGHEDTLAVFVTEPRRPDRKELKPALLLGLLWGLEGGGSSALSVLSLVSSSTSTAATKAASPTTKHHLIV